MDKDGVSRSVSEHVLWCLGERDRLRVEVAAYRDGTLTVGEPQIGGPLPTQGTITRIMYLQHTIADLSRVIDAFSPSGPGQPPVT